MLLLVNKYRRPLVKDVSTGKEIAAKMLELLHFENTLQQYVEDLEQKKPVNRKKYDAQHCLFPKLTEHDVRSITFGRQTHFLLHNRFYFL